MRQKALHEHTYELRARQFDRVLRASMREEAFSYMEPVARAS
jgi:hypothetical protein